MLAISGSALLVHNVPTQPQQAQVVPQPLQPQPQQLDSADLRSVDPHLVDGNWPVRTGFAVAAHSVPSRLRPPQATPQAQRLPQLLTVLTNCARPLQAAGRMLVVSGFVHHAPSALLPQHLH